MALQHAERPWYAVQVRANQEGFARTLLESRSYETFLPTYVAIRRWSDRRKRLELPLFPGYVFCRIAHVERVGACTLRPVIRIVGNGSAPTPVDETELEALQSVIRADLDRQPCEQLAVGQRVVVVDGPLAGHRGRLDESRRRCRFVVSISLIERSVAVEIPATSLLPLDVAKDRAIRRTAA